MEEFELETGESITRLVRKHWLVFVGWVFPFFILALLPLFIPNFLHVLTSNTPGLSDASTFDFSLANPWMRLVLGSWWLLLWIGSFNAFTRYYLNVWVVTNIRIVDIHQYGFFDRRVSSFLLNRVQDVTTEVNGLFPTLFGFGTVRVETAGDDSRHFAMAGIRDPEGMRDLIMREIALLQGDSTQKTPSTGV